MHRARSAWAARGDSSSSFAQVATSGGGDPPRRTDAAQHQTITGVFFRHEMDDRVTLKLSYPSRKLAHARRVATMASTNSARVAGGFRQRISPTPRMSSSGTPDTCAHTRNAAGKFRRPFLPGLRASPSAPRGMRRRRPPVCAAVVARAARGGSSREPAPRARDIFRGLAPLASRALPREIPRGALRSRG